MLNLYQNFPLDNIIVNQQYPNLTGEINLDFTIYNDIQLNQIIIKKGYEKSFFYNLNIPIKNSQAAKINNSYLCPISPNQLFFYSIQNQLDSEILAFQKDIFYCSEQSYSRQLIQIKGTKANQLLAHGCQLNLSSFNTLSGFCSYTLISNINCFIHKLDSKPLTYNLLVFNGLAEDFWKWLIHNAKQFGYKCSRQ